MSLYNIYTICFLVSLLLGAVWSFLDKNKPSKILEFIAKWLARSLVLFVLLVIIVGFFALVSAGLSAKS
ncbi:hypothetical protein SAMN02745165_00510 [Malonomonas rubra DSM 5091]|uniref:Uncharacterized protein n=1 Tax=Malonomonas rubra DSM 5091 TaxID=1122189 RepID=A0A1M6CFA8_MALRU|nr:hypothetical protein [Malonomonas rubra]SHI59720.1 hypothetical protein SAMN02745165_00510 [Malonomonas rubra DSM 5091]